jgi:hypothetical protein
VARARIQEVIYVKSALNAVAALTIVAGIVLLLSTKYTVPALLTIFAGCSLAFGISFRDAYRARRSANARRGEGGPAS